MEQQLLLLYARLKKEAERCNIYAMRAKKDGNAKLSLLLRAIAASQDMQAQRFLMQLRGRVGSTSDNEKEAFVEELPGIIMEYQTMLADAEQQQNMALETGFRHSITVQEQGLELHRQLERQQEVTEYHVCDFCGYIATSEPPENCPVCTAPKNRFKKIDTV